MIHFTKAYSSFIPLHNKRTNKLFKKNCYNKNAKDYSAKKVTILICIFLVSLLPVMVVGQNNSLSIGAEVARPGSYSQSYNNRGIGYGGSLRFESSWDKHVSGMATASFLSFAKRSPDSFYPTYTHQVNAILIQLGVKYYILEKKKSLQGLFLSGELGSMPTSTRIVFTDGSKKNRKENGLSLALGVGYQYKKLESSFRLQYNLSDRGFNVYYYNFRFAYSFLKSKKKSYVHS